MTEVYLKIFYKEKMREEGEGREDTIYAKC